MDDKYRSTNKDTLTFIKLLMDGARIKIGQHTFLLSADYALCVLAHNQHGEERLVKVGFGDAPLSVYRSIIKSATDDEITSMIANGALNAINKKD